MHTQGPQILGVTAKKFVAIVTRRPGFAHPLLLRITDCFKYVDLQILITLNLLNTTSEFRIVAMFYLTTFHSTNYISYVKHQSLKNRQLNNICAQLPCCYTLRHFLHSTSLLAATVYRCCSPCLVSWRVCHIITTNCWKSKSMSNPFS